MSTNWVNPDGLEVNFGPQRSERYFRVNRARETVTAGAFRQLEVNVDLSELTDATENFMVDSDNDGTLDAHSLKDAYLPAYSAITRCVFVSSETAAGGTDVEIGLQQQDGTEVDNDGLFVDLLTAEMAVGEVSHGDGALVQDSGIGAASIGANDAFITITPNGTFTAGQGRLIVEFITPVADS